jgi:MFS family permease
VTGEEPTLGLRANWRQFWLLVLVNAFVGSMVGLERTVLPLLAGAEFGLASTSAAVSFIAVFGLTKALTNLGAGYLGDRFGRRCILIAGWLFGLPVPLLVIAAPTWSWIVFANVLLGINQGLAWSTTVIMKIDLVGPQERGLAMGLNEFAGYIAVALTALATGYVAERHGLRPAPFYLGFALATAGLALSWLFVRETRQHAEAEARDSLVHNANPSFWRLFGFVSWRSPALFSASQAGLVNNLNDGLAWGVFPLFFAARGLSISEIGFLGFTYPAVWGSLQVWTGALSDRLGRKRLIAAGLLLQSVALFLIAAADGFRFWVASAALLGLGTAMVYPTLLATIGDVAHPRWRGSAVGIYRLWRDSGYVVGALLAGLLSDLWGMPAAIGAVGAITLLSGIQVAWRMPETRTLHAA